MSDETPSQSAAPDPSPSTPPAVPSPSTPPADFRSLLNDEWKSHPALKDYKDVNAMAKSLVHAQQMVGADKVVIPNEKSSKDVWDNYYKKLGRPDDVSGYELPQADIPGGIDEGFRGKMLAKMHEMGVSKKQAQELFKEYSANAGAIIGARLEAEARERSQGVEKLKSEWGPDFDKNVNGAKHALQQFGSPELLGWLEKSGQGDNPELIRAFAKIGESLMEDPTTMGGRGSGGGGFMLNPDAARAEIASSKTDKEFMEALGNRAAPGHKEAVEKWQRLHKAAFPGKGLQ